MKGDRILIGLKFFLSMVYLFSQISLKPQAILHVHARVTFSQLNGDDSVSVNVIGFILFVV